MTDLIADLTLGVKPAAAAVLALLQREPDFADHSGSRYLVEVGTRAWYNGRERGVSLTVQTDVSDKKHLVITFGECRSSDDIFVDHWVVDGFPPFNAPGVADQPEESYSRREEFRYAENAAERIYGIMADYYARRNAEIADESAVDQVMVTT